MDVQGTTYTVEPLEGGPMKRVHRTGLRPGAIPVPTPRTRVRPQTNSQPVVEEGFESAEPDFFVVEDVTDHPTAEQVDVHLKEDTGFGAIIGNEPGCSGVGTDETEPNIWEGECSDDDLHLGAGDDVLPGDAGRDEQVTGTGLSPRVSVPTEARGLQQGVIQIHSTYPCLHVMRCQSAQTWSRRY